MPKVNLPLGIDSFEKLRANDCYYIDKTGFIKELLSETFDVNLITRPRRFGKTLAMSMLAEFFDIRKDSRKMFEGLAVAGDEDFCRTWMNQWPVLFLTLKNVDGNSYEGAYGLLQYTIAALCGIHEYLLESEKVREADKKILERLLMQKGTRTDVQCALDTLMRMMKVHYGKDVILLIDEYDVPLAKASDHGYYEEMLDIMRSFLGMVWKTNPSLKFAVVTGCLRIAKESIFTGSNNFVSNSISGDHYQDYFGFTEQEVRKLLADAGCPGHFEELKTWYDGYLFGSREIYCPWDVVNHVNLLLRKPAAKPDNYWKNTSHNNIIRKFIELPDMEVNDKFETLLAGGLIQERIVEDLTYDIAHSSEDNLWSVLYLTGYLTHVLPENIPEEMELASGTTALRIPNEEVKTIFADTIAKWFTDTIAAKDRGELFREWWSGADDKLTKEVSDILFDTISYFDYKEDYYHAFLTGLFSGAGFAVSSNSEQGTGRADIIVKDRRNRRAIVIEVKRSEREGTLAGDCEKAIAQIRERQYTRKIQIEGYETILCYGAAFFGKNCMVKYDRL